MTAGNASLKQSNQIHLSKNVSSWLISLQNIFESQNVVRSEAQKVQYAISYPSDDGLQWWKLVKINSQKNIQTFECNKTEILKYVEPVNREVNARKALSALKQMSAFSSITPYNAECSKWLLQVQ